MYGPVAGRGTLLSVRGVSAGRIAAFVQASAYRNEGSGATIRNVTVPA